MNLHDPILELVRAHIVDTLFGAIFLFIGLCACTIAAIRRQSQVRLLVWCGLFIGMYGARMLANVATALDLAPGSPWPIRIDIFVNYTIVIPSLLFWAELSRGFFRRIFLALALAASIIAIVGFSWFFMGKSPYTFLRFNSVIAVFSMIVLGVLFVLPGATKKYLVLQSRVLRFVVPAIALIVLYVDIGFLFGVPPPPHIEPITFAFWICAIGYEAATHTFENERRLLTIESELETARQIQASILPKQVPTIAGLRIVTQYHPMSAVAGDFYHFLPVDGRRLGVLIADVAGHGVPAALIASMIKVALQSIIAFTSNPSHLLRNLNRILTPELSGRLISAAYLWIDAEAGWAQYSAAGHPPLLHWKAGRNELLSIESNGLLFGVAMEAEYPVRTLELSPCDRLLLYTDGLIEPENKYGESFGDRQIEHILNDNRARSAPELAAELVSSLARWQPASSTPEDDVTLIVVDILKENQPSY
ncbi:MAG TPA: PP2C family protein-serine/threonine phosphatase [Terracidiphilus sp.]|nr:PP2C family protein-serine/threonine phosphatase [Terracidiphilus sp.]